MLCWIISQRENHTPHTHIKLSKCVQIKEIDGCIAAHTITNLFFILRKDLSIAERKAALLKLCRVFTVVGIDISKILFALENDNFNDLEDCLQDECAEDFNADYLITRNADDFKNGKIKVIEPREFLSMAI